MKKNRFLLLSILIFINMGWVAACAKTPEQSTPASTAGNEVSLSPTISYTASPVPTATPSPTFPSSPTILTISTPTTTLLPMQIQLLTHGPLPNWQYLVTFENDEPVTGEYLLIVDKNKKYACSTRTDHPYYLYCVGPMAGIDTTISFTLYTLEPKQEVLSGEFYIPYQFAP